MKPAFVALIFQHAYLMKVEEFEGILQHIERFMMLKPYGHLRVQFHAKGWGMFEVGAPTGDIPIDIELVDNEIGFCELGATYNQGRVIHGYSFSEMRDMLKFYRAMLQKDTPFDTFFDVFKRDQYPISSGFGMSGDILTKIANMDKVQ